MPRRRKRDNRRAWLTMSSRRGRRIASCVSGAVCVVVFASILAYRLFWTTHPEAHNHPPAPHSGQVVVFEAGPTHYHVEFVVEPTGVVHLFPLDESATRPLAVDSRPLIFTVQSTPRRMPSRSCSAPFRRMGRPTGRRLGSSGDCRPGRSTGSCAYGLPNSRCVGSDAGSSSNGSLPSGTRHSAQPSMRSNAESSCLPEENTCNRTFVRTAVGRPMPNLSQRFRPTTTRRNQGIGRVPCRGPRPNRPSRG